MYCTHELAKVPKFLISEGVLKIAICESVVVELNISEGVRNNLMISKGFTNNSWKFPRGCGKQWSLNYFEFVLE